MIIKRVTLIDSPLPPFVGSLATVAATPDCMEWGINTANFAPGCASATIDWGDGTIETYDDIDWCSHEYAAPGTYVVKLPDCFSVLQISFGRKSQATTAPALIGFTSNAQKLTTLGSACFAYCSNLAQVDLSAGAITTIEDRVFRSCTSLPSRIDLKTVTQLDGFSVSLPFTDCTSVEEIHFAAQHEAAIKSGTAYQDDPQLGAPNATVYFDL